MRRSPPSSSLAGAVILVALALPVAGHAQTPTPTIRWQACPTAGGSARPATTPTSNGLECGELEVPLDYAQPDGAQITLGFDRLPAKDPKHRVGSLVFDPGGPGGSGGSFVAGEATGARVFSPALRDRFDLIGLDPRGVGLSTPARCDPAVYNQPVSLFPRNETEFRQLVAHNQALGESCPRMTGPLLVHLDTVSAARDIELLRKALGEDKLNYLGLSYGSMLCAQYAALYPDHIRVMALDGAVDHDLSETAMLAGEAAADEQEFDRFAAWCGQDATCALHGQDVAALFDRLAARADTTPLPAPACAKRTAPSPCRPTVTGADLRLNAEDMLFWKEPLPAPGMPGWNGFAKALAQAAAGDASAFSTELAVGPQDNAYASGLGIACLDFPSQSMTYQRFAAKELLGRVIAPHMQGASGTWVTQANCLGWPLPVVNPPHPADVRGAPPILIVNATHDPATSYVWAHGLLNQIAGAVLLTRDGDGHTSALNPGATRDAIDAYLLTGATPPPNSVYQN